ncbi:unnamed protein product [Lactuca saligna]|uniref:Uncharacterized protein n=1 Tax=Lactuca saligna TaxID=75948 RepID=A0AA35YE44_LACSI|nr:unnamed protein product [Lactuca saligna]
MKKTETGSSDKPVKESKSTKIPKKQPIVDREPVTHEVLVADTPLTSQEKEIIPSKTSVFRRIKMKSKHKSIPSLTNIVRNPHVTHQGVLFREIPVPVSPSSKKQRAADMAKNKSNKVIISFESTDDKDERIPETPELIQKDTSVPL